MNIKSFVQSLDSKERNQIFNYLVNENSSCRGRNAVVTLNCKQMSYLYYGSKSECVEGFINLKAFSKEAAHTYLDGHLSNLDYIIKVTIQDGFDVKVFVQLLEYFQERGYKLCQDLDGQIWFNNKHLAQKLCD